MSPRAKTIAHLQALVAAATAAAAATATGCGKGKAEKKPEDPYGSSGYAVVDPLPEPSIIQPPIVPPSLVYTGRVKVTIKQEKGGKTTFRLTPDAPDLVFDDVVAPTSVVKRETVAKTRELVVTVEKTNEIVVSAHGEAGAFKITASVGDAGAVTVTLSQ